MKTNDKKKKKLLGAAAALALLAALSGTFAWITAQDQKINRVETGDLSGDVVITEEWHPVPITPGGTATKDVKVTNTGGNRVFVRASFEEVLQYLTSKGTETAHTASLGHNYDPDSTKPYSASAALTADVPVSVKVDLTEYTTANGWYDIASMIGITDPDTKVYGKGKSVYNPSTGLDYATIEPVAWHEYDTPGGDTFYQKVELEVDIVGTPAAGTPVPGWSLTLKSGPDYKFYDTGYQFEAVSWAESAFESPWETTPGTVSGFALLGYQGEKDGVDFNYLDPSVITLPTMHTPLSSIAPSGTEQSQADKNVFGPKEGIDIQFSAADITAVGTLAPNSWVYNKDDGWFYYTSILDGGKTTKSLMKSLKFTDDIDSEYNNAVYDLDVKMEAVQADPTSLADSTGWGMNATGGGDTQTIHDYLAGL